MRTSIVILFSLLSHLCYSQSVVTFMIKKPKVNPLNTILPCHNKVFYHGNIENEKPNLRGFGSYYHDLNYSWIDFQTSTFYVNRDTGSFITQNHKNGHLYWLDTNTDLLNGKYDLDLFKLDSLSGKWLGYREDTISRKNVIKTKVELKDCQIIIIKAKGYYKKDYLYKYTKKNEFNEEISRWKLTFKKPLITWVPLEEPDYEYFEQQVPKSVLSPYLDEVN